MFFSPKSSSGLLLHWSLVLSPFYFFKLLSLSLVLAILFSNSFSFFKLPSIILKSLGSLLVVLYLAQQLSASTFSYCSFRGHLLSEAASTEECPLFFFGWEAHTGVLTRQKSFKICFSCGFFLSSPSKLRVLQKCNLYSGRVLQEVQLTWLYVCTMRVVSMRLYAQLDVTGVAEGGAGSSSCDHTIPGMLGKCNPICQWSVNLGSGSSEVVTECFYNRICCRRFQNAILKMI